MGDTTVRLLGVEALLERGYYPHDDGCSEHRVDDDDEAIAIPHLTPFSGLEPGWRIRGVDRNRTG